MSSSMKCHPYVVEIEEGAGVPSCPFDKKFVSLEDAERAAIEYLVEEPTAQAACVFVYDEIGQSGGREVASISKQDAIDRDALQRRDKLKATIIAGLEQFGWKKESIVDAFCKTFVTAVVPVEGSIWLKFEKEFQRWWLRDGDFTSAGENVLAASYLILSIGMTEAEAEQAIASFVVEMERKIAGAWSVRLLGLPTAGSVGHEGGGQC